MYYAFYIGVGGRQDASLGTPGRGEKGRFVKVLLFSKIY